MDSFFNWELIDFSKTNKTSGEIVTLCPVCSATRKKKKEECLGVNLDSGIAHCCHCGAKSKRDFENKMEYKQVVYKLPEWKNRTQLSDNVVKWFRDKRGISQQTLIDNDIQEGLEWMPQTQKQHNCIKYPYVLDSTVVNIKYRTAEKLFKLSKDAKKVLLGIDNLKSFKTAYIVEGENDYLCFHEQGKKNVLSVPNGVALSEKEKSQYLQSGMFNDDNALNLDYLTESLPYLEHIEKWIICTDDDPAGKKLQRELIRRLGAENCEIADLRGCNDPNELHLKDPKGLKNLKSNPIPLDGVFTVEDEWDYIMYIRNNGYDLGNPIGIPEFDKHYTFRLNELDLITGIPNHGKTTYMAWEMVITAVLFGWKWAIYSPENYPIGELYISIIEILSNKSISKKDDYCCSDEEMEVAKSFVSEHFFVIDWDDDGVLVTPEMILDKTKQLIKLKGVNGLLVDPWNDLYHEFKNGENDSKYLQRQLSLFRRFKRKYNVKTIINGHPTVSKQREREDHPEQGERPKVVWFYDMDGGAMWGNRMDNCRTVYRNTKDELYRHKTELHVQKIKFQKLVGIPTDESNPIELELKQYRFYISGIDPIYDFKLVVDDEKEQIDSFDEKTGEVHIDYIENFEKIDDSPF